MEQVITFNNHLIVTDICYEKASVNVESKMKRKKLKA